MTTHDNGPPITIWPPTTFAQTARERLAGLVRLGLRDAYVLDGADVAEAIVARIMAHHDPAGYTTPVVGEEA